MTRGFVLPTQQLDELGQTLQKAITEDPPLPTAGVDLRLN